MSTDFDVNSSIIFLLERGQTVPKSLWQALCKRSKDSYTMDSHADHVNFKICVGIGHVYVLHAMCHENL